MDTTTLSEPSADTPLARGVAALRDALQHIPLSPGVYRMMNDKGDVLYVGKAKRLKNRVGSYTNIGTLSTRILRMVSQIARVEWTTLGSEAEALLVEANQIKQLKPRYNILLKDDKSFPYLMFTGNHPYPRIKKHRGAQSEAGEYFGPFASVGALNQALSLMQRVFLLRPCSDSIFKNRSRPCLQYQIKRCSAPCVGLIGEAEYAAQLTLARRFLEGKSRDVQERLSEQMLSASAAMQFERAAELRDRIRALTQVQQEQGLKTAGLKDADVLCLHQEAGRSVVMMAYFRQGMHCGQRSYFPSQDEDASPEAVMAAFIGQFYQQHTPPREVLVNCLPEEPALLREALALRAGHGVEMKLPERGDKKQLVDAVLAQAREALQRQVMEAAAVREHLAQLANLFGLAAPPERIEIYDNSHNQGSFQLGAMVVATPEGFKKTAYRQFNRHAEQTGAGDDVAMMREVMRRRFRGAAAGAEAVLPDLMLIDGGKPQLGAVLEVMASLGLAHIPVVAIAKGEDRNAGREWFFMEGRLAFQLPINDPTLHYLQRLRDEAHRFAIGSHRNKRSKALTRSALDDIAGIGPKRKKALLMHFGSRSAVATATHDELCKVEGINDSIARQIFDFFHAKA